MDLKKQIENIVGVENLLDDPEEMEHYSKDQSFVQPKMPDFVVKAKEVSQIQDIIRLANRTSTPITPYSSGLNLHGATVPTYGGMVLDLSGMDRIIEINEKDLFIIIEPGVTYEILQDALQQKALRVMVPFGVPPGRSVLTSYLERDVMMSATTLEYGS